MLVLVKTKLKALHGCLLRKVDVHLASLALGLQVLHSNNLKPVVRADLEPRSAGLQSDTLTTRSRYLLFILLLLLFTVSRRRSFRCNQRKKTSGHKKGISLCIQHT